MKPRKVCAHLQKDKANADSRSAKSFAIILPGMQVTKQIYDWSIANESDDGVEAQKFVGSAPEALRSLGKSLMKRKADKQDTFADLGEKPNLFPKEDRNKLYRKILRYRRSIGKETDAISKYDQFPERFEQHYLEHRDAIEKGLLRRNPAHDGNPLTVWCKHCLTDVFPDDEDIKSKIPHLHHDMMTSETITKGADAFVDAVFPHLLQWRKSGDREPCGCADGNLGCDLVLGCRAELELQRKEKANQQVTVNGEECHDCNLVTSQGRKHQQQPSAVPLTALNAPVKHDPRHHNNHLKSRAGLAGQPLAFPPPPFPPPLLENHHQQYIHQPQHVGFAQQQFMQRQLNNQHGQHVMYSGFMFINYHN